LKSSGSGMRSKRKVETHSPAIDVSSPSTS
jgi:hypothetical protein